MTICTECNEPCHVVVVDFGIGPYEFWGQKCNHVDKHEVSDCCEAEVVEREPGDTPATENLEKNSGNCC